MKHYLLIYHLAPDYLDRRPQFREAHLALAKAAVARGELLLGGALDPADRAMLLFAGEDGSAAERFAEGDPYVANGLVERWEVRGWTTVVGKGRRWRSNSSSCDKRSNASYFRPARS